MAKTLLFVDDEKEFTAVLARVFGMRGYTVLEASSGDEALAILLKNTVDLVTLDLNMPGLNGIETAKEINAKYANTKIIIISGFGADFDQQINEIKVDCLIPKPLDLALAMDKIKELIGLP